MSVGIHLNNRYSIQQAAKFNIDASGLSRRRVASRLFSQACTRRHRDCRHENSIIKPPGGGSDDESVRRRISDIYVVADAPATVPGTSNFERKRVGCSKNCPRIMVSWHRVSFVK